MPASHPYKRTTPRATSSSSNTGTMTSATGSLVHERITSSKRTRGEMACAECRRLKIRCDRTIPCSSCRKRGCTALCPNGTIPPGEASRFVVAASDHLRIKMHRMEARMHALEDALAIVVQQDAASASTSPQSPKGKGKWTHNQGNAVGTHPLLRPPLSQWDSDVDDDLSNQHNPISSTSSSSTPSPLLHNPTSSSKLPSTSTPQSKSPSNVVDTLTLGLGTLYIAPDDDRHANRTGRRVDNRAGEAGQQRFFGASGGSESLLLKAKHIKPSSNSPITPPRTLDLDTSYLSPEILSLSSSFPFTFSSSKSSIPVSSSFPDNSNPFPRHSSSSRTLGSVSSHTTGIRVVNTAQSTIISLLPPRARVMELIDMYFAGIHWMAQIVDKEWLVKDVVRAIYDDDEDDYELDNNDIVFNSNSMASRDHADEELTGATTRPLWIGIPRRAPSAQTRALPRINTQSRRTRKRATRSYTPHSLALLLAVLSIGATLDLHLPAYNLEGQHYYLLATASMSLQCIFTQQSLVTVRALHLLSIYNGLSGREGKMETCYTLLNLAGQVALTIGLHIDPSKWGMRGREAYERREYFYTLLTGIMWQALVTGRPPVILSNFVNCKIPSPEEQRLYMENVGFGVWGHRATHELLVPLARATLGAKAPAYSHVLELDRKIREFGMPVQNTPKVEDTSSDEEDNSMRTFIRSHYRDLMLLFLHRAFFAQAMTEKPQRPMDSPYAHSFFAAYHSACSVLLDTQEQFRRKPVLCARIWRIWSLAFSASVVIGTVAVRECAKHFKPPPLERFETACALFEAAAETSTRAARALPILHIIRDKARRSDQAFRACGESSESPEEVEEDEELSLFGGFTSLLAPNRQSSGTVRTPIPSDEPSSWSGGRSGTIALPTLPDGKRGTLPSFSETLDLPMPMASPRRETFDRLVARGTPPPVIYPSGQHSSSSNPPLSSSPPPQTSQHFHPQHLPSYEHHLQQQHAWHDLYREIPGSYDIGMASGYVPERHQHQQLPAQGASASGGRNPFGDTGQEIMLDDRWSSFMYNYGTLAEQREPQHQSHQRHY